MAFADVAQIGCYINRTYTFARPCVLRLSPEWVSVTLTPDGRQLTVDGVPKLQHIGTHRIVVQECGVGVPVAPERPAGDSGVREAAAGVGSSGGGSGRGNGPVVVGFGSGERSEYHVLELHVVPTRLHKCCGLVASVAVILALALYVWSTLYAVLPDGPAVPAVTMKAPVVAVGAAGAQVRLPPGVAVGDVHHGQVQVGEGGGGADGTGSGQGVGAAGGQGARSSSAHAHPGTGGAGEPINPHARQR